MEMLISSLFFDTPQMLRVFIIATVNTFNLCLSISLLFRNRHHWQQHLAYPLITRIVGAPQMISQPVSPFFSVLHCPLGLGELQVCPFPDVVFPPLPLSALSSSPFHRALQDVFGQPLWTGNMTIPLQFASLHIGQEVFVWSDWPDFPVGNMVFVWDA